jgi:hypothetical protein
MQQLLTDEPQGATTQVLHALHAAWCVLLAVRRMFYGVVNTRDVQSLPMEGTWNAQWA